jgi:hypothetical protein
VQFQTRTQQPSTASESANAPPVGMTFIASFFSKIITYTGIYSLFSICRRNIGESTHGDFLPKFTKD